MWTMASSNHLQPMPIFEPKSDQLIQTLIGLNGWNVLTRTLSPPISKMRQKNVPYSSIKLVQKCVKSLKLYRTMEKISILKRLWMLSPLISSRTRTKYIRHICSDKPNNCLQRQWISTTLVFMVSPNTVTFTTQILRSKRK